MENIEEIISKTCSLTEVVPQSIQWALLGLGAFKVAQHLLVFAKGKVLEGVDVFLVLWNPSVFFPEFQSKYTYSNCVSTFCRTSVEFC